MQVSLSELKLNPGKYVDLVDEQDVYITRHGRKVARLTSAASDKKAAAKALFGILPEAADLDATRVERLK